MTKLHEIAVRLCEGQPVWFNGHLIRAFDYKGNENACFDCTMDCLCNMEMTDLCAECDGYHHHQHYLALVDNHDYKPKQLYIF